MGVFFYSVHAEKQLLSFGDALDQKVVILHV